MSGEIRVILMGNAGVCKTTMSNKILETMQIPRLSLDEIAWDEGAVRKSHEASRKDLMNFINDNPSWIVEGFYSDLIEEALPYCTELRFLNPGVAVAMERCKRRPFEPEKLSSKEEQDANLANLILWVSEYETRQDEYGLKRHREIFESFEGPKIEFESVGDYAAHFPQPVTNPST